MIVLSEDTVEEVADWPSLIAAMEQVFAACARREVDNFPFVRARLWGDEALFGVKSGCNYASGELGLKCGGYWNTNAGRGLDRHQSTVLLLDLATGQPRALVAGNNLTAYRTAAAGAAAARRLAAPDAARLAILGTGRQALFQLEALRHVRSIEHVCAWGPTAEHVQAFGRRVEARGLQFRAADTPQAAVEAADIVVTVTPSTEPLLRRGDVKAGVHINAMGSDTRGKRELAADLLSGGLWVDDLDQSRSIGEGQHLPAGAEIRLLGELFLDDAPAPRDPQEITVFDGTGLALQDLAAATLVLAAAQARGLGRAIEL